MAVCQLFPTAAQARRARTRQTSQGGVTWGRWSSVDDAERHLVDELLPGIRLLDEAEEHWLLRQVADQVASQPGPWRHSAGTTGFVTALRRTLDDCWQAGVDAQALHDSAAAAGRVAGERLLHVAALLEQVTSLCQASGRASLPLARLQLPAALRRADALPTLLAGGLRLHAVHALPAARVAWLEELARRLPAPSEVVLEIPYAASESASQPISWFGASEEWLGHLEGRGERSALRVESSDPTSGHGVGAALLRSLMHGPSNAAVPLSGPQALAGVVLLAGDDVGAEARGIAQQIRVWLDAGVPAEQIAIVRRSGNAADEAVVAALQAADVPVCAAGRSKTGQAIDWARQCFALATACGEAIESNASASAAQVELRLQAWLRRLHERPQQATAAWAVWLQQRGNPLASLEAQATAVQLAMPQQLAAALRSLRSALPHFDATPRTWAQWLHELGRGLPIAAAPLASMNGGVQVLPVAEVIGGDWQAVVLPQLQEGELPAVVGEDPLLPEAERRLIRRLQRQTRRAYGSGEAVLDEVVFTTTAPLRDQQTALALASAERHVLVSWALADDAGKALAPAAVFVQYGARLASLGARNRRASSSETLRAAQRPRPPLRLTLAASTAVASAQSVHSISELEAMAACPFRHFARTRLGIRRLAPMQTLEPTANARGELLHACFEAALRALQKAGWLPYRASKARPAARLARWVARQTARTHRHASGLPTALAKVACDETAHCIGRLVQHLYESDDGYAPVALEQSFDVTLPLDAANGLRLRGRIDLIERRDADVRVADLKSSKLASLHLHLQPAALGHTSLQLPLYAAVAAAILDCEAEHVDACYLSLGEGQRSRSLRQSMASKRGAWRQSETPAEQLLTLRQQDEVTQLGRRVQELTAQIGAQDRRIAPAEGACQHCDYGTLCRLPPALRQT